MDTSGDLGVFSWLYSKDLAPATNNQVQKSTITATSYSIYDGDAGYTPVANPPTATGDIITTF